MNKMYGFEGEVKAKYDQATMDLFAEVFCALPLAAVVNNGKGEWGRAGGERDAVARLGAATFDCRLSLTLACCCRLRCCCRRAPRVCRPRWPVPARWRDAG